MTHKKQLTALFHEYERHIGRPATLRDVVEWGLGQGRIVEPQLDPVAALVSDMKDALRAETRVDDEGREYRANAAITFTNDGGIQESLWGDVDLNTTSDKFMIEHFGQRRKGILDDCVKLKDDVDHFNDHRYGKEPHQLVLDFTDDVAERLAMRDTPKAAE